MPRISALVLTKNEEEMIPHCLSCLQWVDEILVVDSFSNDRTVPLAEAAGARVLQHPFGGFASQTNWGAEQATGDWILQIDADELVTPRLRDAVLATAAANPATDIFAVRRDSYVFAHLMRASSWSKEYIPRFYRKGTLTFTGEVHPDPQYGGRSVGRLEGVLLHYPYRHVPKYFDKFQLYSTMWAEKARERGRRTSLPLAVASSLWRFFHNYFIRGEMWDGRVGFAMSALGGMHTFIRHIKLWGLQNAEEFARVHEVRMDGEEKQ